MKTTIKAVEQIVRPTWPDGTPKSVNNDFNWQAPRSSPSPWSRLAKPQLGPNNTNFNLPFAKDPYGIA